jgi:DNA-binding NtrC family response regulator
MLEHTTFDLIISDVKLPVMDGLEFIGYCKERDVQSKYIVVTGYSDESAIIRALRLGVDDFLKKPYREGELLHAVSQSLKMLRLEEENRRYKERLETENTILHRELDKRMLENVYSIVGNARVLEKSLTQANKVAQYSINALIRGESGTGKEMMAQYIYHNGIRSKQPFVAVNCAALSPSLFEAELFGYEKGAFTGAQEARAGLFEVANGGVLFLDELTEIPIGLQAKLLRVVESQTIRRVGGSQTRSIDVQILCSTNRTIGEAIEQGFLRLDLYHRLATVEIVLPPLRERMEDFPALVEHFIRLYERQLGLKAAPLPNDVQKFLMEQRWEGNIRQLSNVIKRWCLFGDDANVQDVSLWLQSPQSSRSAERQPTERLQDAQLREQQPSGVIFQALFANGTFEELERAKYQLIEMVLHKYHGNKSQAARHLGISYPGLLKMLKAKEAASQTHSQTK